MIAQAKRIKIELGTCNPYPCVARLLIAVLFFSHLSTSPELAHSSHERGEATFGQLTTEEKYFFESGRATVGARYYDMRSGRFLSPDPLGHASSMNLYDYANGDPVNGVDPDGRYGKGVASGYTTGANGGDTIYSNSTANYLGGLTGWAVGSDVYQFNSAVENYVAAPARQAIGLGFTALNYATTLPDKIFQDGTTALAMGMNTAWMSELGAMGRVSKVGSMESIGSQSLIRQNVLGNIAESQAARASSNYSQFANFNTALDFYSTTTNWSGSRIASHLQGIDFSMSVNVVEVRAGTTLIQYNLPGRVGNYYTLSGTPSNTLGIYTSGLIESSYTFSTPTRALQSTAASVIDDWSMSGAGWKIEANGGGTQFFIPSR